jgi:hypothetical protein
LTKRDTPSPKEVLIASEKAEGDEDDADAMKDGDSVDLLPWNRESFLGREEDGHVVNVKS